ncbi:hypothetical protein BgiBS90_025292, partial [Biomphalaria glabrata]
RRLFLRYICRKQHELPADGSFAYPDPDLSNPRNDHLSDGIDSYSPGVNQPPEAS